MNKQDNKLAISVIATLTAGIALIYTLIMYHNFIFAVAGVSILFLITAFILTQNIIAFVTMKNKSINVHIKNCVDDISTQLEALSGAQAQLGKATYIYTKQAAQKVATLENNYIESQDALYKNLASISTAQNKATKLMIKYDQNNTNKLISSIKDMRNKLSETMVNGFDQIQPNNSDVIAELESIVNYLKSQSNSGDQALGLQLNNVAHELQNISNSIRTAQVQMPVAGMMQAVAPSQPMADTAMPMAEEIPVMEEPVAEEVSVMEEAPVIEDAAPESPVMDEETIAEEAPAMEEASLEELLAEEAPVMEDAAAEEAPAMEEAPANEEPVAETPVIEKDANEKLDPDEIAALFAAAEATIEKTEEILEETPEINEVEEEEAFTPTFTVVGKSDEVEEEPHVPTLADLPDDPNKQLSPDEIAALFASADPAPKKEPAPEPAAAAPADDPNKQLTPDEIAAMFAAAEPTPKKEDKASAEEKEMDAALANAAPTPVSDDPNKQLSPDEIAALFASMG